MIPKNLVTKENLFYLLLGSFLLLLVAKEARVIPITHDEVSTIVFSQQSIYDIVTYQDPIPNNHILNTLLLKASIAIFGDIPFTDRLPNILSFIPYFLFSVLISKLLFKDNWLRLAMVLMLTLQPYLLDFYSLTRGYGMSVSLQMVSLFYFFRRLQSGRHIDLVVSISVAALAVYANFTLLNYFLPLGLLLGLDSLFSIKTTGTKNVLRDIASLAGTSIVLGAASYLPITKMMATKQFVFWGSSGFFNDTISPLLYSLRHGVQYLRWESSQIAWLTVGVFSIILIIGILLSIGRSGAKTFHYNLALLGLVLVYNNLQFYVMEVPFLNARTALFFIPLVVINLCCALDVIRLRKEYIGLTMIIIFCGLSIQHFVRGANFRSSFEWYYDANTYDVINDLHYIITTENIPQPVKVNCHWTFYPSLNYHLQQQFPDMINLVPYHKEIQPETDASFYYTQSDEVAPLSPRFDKTRDYSWGSRFLLRSK